MAGNVVYAKSNTVLALGGHRHSVRAWEPWDGDDPLVAAYPGMFVDSLEAVRSTVHPSGLTQIEQATRAPGETRTARRPRQSGTK